MSVELNAFLEILRKNIKGIQQYRLLCLDNISTKCLRILAVAPQIL
jgi:hypothetical protein